MNGGIPVHEPLTQNCYTNASKSKELLPLNIPHNEAILIPNHYSTRATAPNEYTTDESNKVVGKVGNEKNDTSFTTGEDYTAAPFSINQYNSRVKKDLRKHEIVFKPLPPLFRPELSDLKHDINNKIDTDRESQIAWSEEDSVHTDWSESNVWSDEDEDAVDKNKRGNSL